MATIVQILPSLHAGGVERGTVEIASALIEAGHRAVVFSAGGGMVAELEAIGAKHVTIDAKSKNPFTALKRVRILADLLIAEKVDLLHFRSRVPAWLSILARRMALKKGRNIPLLSTYHGVYAAQNSFKRFYNSAMIRADHTIAVTHYVAEHIKAEFRGYDAQDITVISRCFDENRYIYKELSAQQKTDFRTQNNLHPTRPILLLVGRLSLLKGVAFISAALAKLPLLDWQFVVVGDYADYPTEVARMKAHFANADISDRLHLLGMRTDLQDIYPQVDVLLCGSQQPEAFGRTIVEAAACGIPAVVPDQGGTAEVVLDCVTGWQYIFRDREDATAKIAEALQCSPVKRKEIGQAARQRADQHYRLSTMQAATLAVYDRLLGK